MAKKHHPSPSPREHSSKKGGIFGIIKTVGIIGILLFGAFIILNQMGVKMVETSEQTEVTNNPRHTQNWDEFEAKKKKKLAEKRNRDNKAEDLLLGFVEDYRKTGGRDLKKSDIKFLEKMDERVKIEGTISNAQQYYKFMKNSFQFYNSMKNFGNVAPKSSSNIQYPRTKEDANKLINRVFKIEQEKLETFTEGDPDTEDWLEFMDEQ